MTIFPTKSGDQMKSQGGNGSHQPGILVCAERHLSLIFPCSFSNRAAFQLSSLNSFGGLTIPTVLGCSKVFS